VQQLIIIHASRRYADAQYCVAKILTRQKEQEKLSSLTLGIKRLTNSITSIRAEACLMRNK